MKIRLLEEIKDREVKFLSKVLCTRSNKHNMSWEFEKNKKYDLFEHILEDNTILYIIYNNGWYSNFTDINILSDKYYDFLIIK